MHYVYWVHLPEHTDIKTQGYVGHTKSFTARMRDHRRQSNFKKSLFYNMVRHYGWDNIVKEVVHTVETQEQAANLEFELRPLPRLGWNLMEGGSISPMHLKETRLKLSDAMSGKVQSREHIEKRASKNRGQRRSDEQRSRISENLKNALGTKKQYRVTFPDRKSVV